MDVPAQVVVIIAIVVVIAVALAVGLFLVPNRSRWGRGIGTGSGRIRVIGVGGGGGNAVDAMIRSRTRGVDFVACNTDAQALRRSIARRKLQIGSSITHGLGAGGDPEIGAQAVHDDADRIAAALRGSDLVFVTAGLGGGTGSGGAPVVAGIARDLGALTVGVVTRPFTFEGTRRRDIAERAHEELLGCVDTLITVPNDRVHGIVPEDATLTEAFAVVDDVLHQGIQGIVDIIKQPGMVNLDFADVRAVMANGGRAILGIGRASGDERAPEAARRAISSALLEDTIDGATGILLCVAGSGQLGLAEVTGAADVVRATADPDANLIFGATVDPRLGEEVRVTVIATGFGPRSRADIVPSSALPVAATGETLVPEAASHASKLATAGETAADETATAVEAPAADATAAADQAARIDDERGSAARESSSADTSGPRVLDDASARTHDFTGLDVPTFMRRKPVGKQRRRS